jgi:excisionase family DNA binding protein
VSATPLERLRGALAPELVDAILELVDERVAAAASVGESGSPWMSLKAAAEYLGVSERTVQRLSKRDLVRSETIGRRRLYHRDDLDAAATGEETAPTAPPRRRIGVE